MEIKFRICIDLIRNTKAAMPNNGTMEIIFKDTKQHCRLKKNLYYLWFLNKNTAKRWSSLFIIILSVTARNIYFSFFFVLLLVQILNMRPSHFKWCLIRRTPYVFMVEFMEAWVLKLYLYQITLFRFVKQWNIQCALLYLFKNEDLSKPMPSEAWSPFHTVQMEGVNKQTAWYWKMGS